ncbi:hypothetical protein ACE3NQ_04520 [Paenibacillus terreus]|uniref:Uncharacterized protein n=1 Tax=Paenibacillus terreus TaxID=1387834 RepID=A0ABV5B3R5_9BACL
MRTLVQRRCHGYLADQQDYPAEFEDFIKLVVPILQDKGLFRKEYEDDTLRGNLGLPYPENKHKKGENSF